MMAGIRGRNTRPELAIRRGLHARGFRYQLHSRNLPGKPDLVFPSRRAVIFVHGCFWHGHDCHLFKWPGTRGDFWRRKLGRNREKDAQTLAALAETGWSALVIWECALRGRTRLEFETLVADTASWLERPRGNREFRGSDGGYGSDGLAGSL